MQYQSDYLGRMQWIIYPDGEKIIYGYDEGGQVTSVEGSHYNQTFPYVTKILYDQYGQRTRIEYGNGTATDYTYNPERRWLETVKTKNKYGQSYQNIRYDFDRVGNVRSYVNDCMDTLSGNYRTDQSYGYDDLYQLIHVTGNTEYYPAISSVPDYKSTYTQDFAFDDKGLGNMMSKVSKETVSPLKVIGDNLNYNIGYVYDENYAHRLVQAGNRYYKYDANGNIICEQDGSFDGSENDESYYKVEQHAEDVYSTDNGWGLFKDESGEARGQTHRYRRTYTWNSRNQLVSSVDSNYSTSYVYGQDGQRSNKYTQGSETLYFNKMWTLHTDNGNSVYGGQYAKNVYLGETRIVTKLARADQKTAHEEMYKQYYYHSDHLGSATMITDWKGKEYQRIEYTPYGETWVEKTNNSGSEFLPYKFTGKEVDQETGLYYYGARYLDPKYSMWISTDPALGEYIPEMGKGNSKNSANLPGMGGVFNHINGNLFAYAGNNPVKYVDPDGRLHGLTSEMRVALENHKKIETDRINSQIEQVKEHARWMTTHKKNENDWHIDIYRSLNDDTCNFYKSSILISHKDTVVFRASIQSTADHPDLNKDETLIGSTIEGGIYSGTLLETSPSYKFAIVLFDAYMIHPNQFTSDKKLQNTTNIGPWSRPYSLGCQIMKLNDFTKMIGLLMEAGYIFSNDLKNQDKIEIKIHVNKFMED